MPCFMAASHPSNSVCLVALRPSPGLQASCRSHRRWRPHPRRGCPPPPHTGGCCFPLLGRGKLGRGGSGGGGGAAVVSRHLQQHGGRPRAVQQLAQSCRRVGRRVTHERRAVAALALRMLLLLLLLR
eukprot:scaffold7695_cov64-Phaeocystis_antarctica.AAC.7